ncbi:choline dehydrogenase [Tieghemostelium lacteum]|uniref:Choline dehydrogenase n=1 Tax=Tieghemostelium lacteum TaxID=361077 RepID=A0A152A963_TIELA|nr:choline dehydrogenase [Tieghemostelium lacteum]|eukprot:KYR02760.1 choline dehydrogenase [Tieghemostelium lacteum]
MKVLDKFLKIIFIVQLFYIGVSYGLLGSILSYYDFIVVGSGVAGGIIVDRLSAQGYNVLLLEAGGPSIAELDGMEYVGTKGTFNPTTMTYKPQRPITKAEVPLYWQTISGIGEKWDIKGAGVGKMIGGSGTHNGMVYQRGVDDDYNNWNVTGWAWNDMLPYFKKVETVLDESLQNDPTRGYSGAIKVKSIPFDVEGSDFIKSCQASGLPLNNNFNQVNYRDGCGYYQFNINQDGERSSTAKEYLVRASKRNNVQVIYRATVTRIKWTFNLLKNRYDATGVEYVKDNQTFTVTMKKEIILSAGALNTPKILLNSGVGDGTYLSQYSSQIPLIKHLPGVGKNLQNHVMVFNTWNYSNCMEDAKKPNYYNLFSIDLEYSSAGAGILGTPGYSVGVWLRGNYSVAQTENLAAIFPGSPGGAFKHPVISLAISLAHPTNIHQVVLSNYTAGEPLINFLQKPSVLLLKPIHNEEVQTLVRGIKESRRILSYPPLVNQVTPFIPDNSYQTDQDLEDWVRSNAINHEHWSASCKMGMVNDPTAVVGPNLKVIGVGKVRVVDASIMPKITHSLVQATVMAIGEKASDLIISDYTGNSIISDL